MLTKMADPRFNENEILRAHEMLDRMFKARGGYTKVAHESETVVRAYGGQRRKNAIVVFCVDNSKLGVRQLRDVVDVPEQHVIVVFRQSITCFARKQLDTMMSESHRDIETIPLARLQFDVTQHALVPRHRAVAAKVLRKLGVAPQMLPAIRLSDPITRWYHWPKGTVVCVTKSNPEGHQYEEYRVVAT